ncbi:hypothetical protein [Curtobacterium luteum]|uniref:hypothetical protein n=1 Tax=Curtobacterium luteum TaxID=33881 RepID=UPI0037F728B4
MIDLSRWKGRLVTLHNNFDDPVFDIRYSLRRVEAETKRIRSEMLTLIEAGILSQRELARHIGVSHSTLGRWLDEARSDRDR